MGLKPVSDPHKKKRLLRLPFGELKSDQYGIETHILREELFSTLADG
jgi:hypothetical protein